MKRFDLRFLLADYLRVGLEFPLDGRVIVDPMEIYHDRERRDLVAAVRFYCGQDHEGAHSAANDVLATAAVLDAMLLRYSDLPRAVSSLHELFQDSIPVDSEGRFVRSKGRLVFNFSPHYGKLLDDVARDHPGFLNWMLAKDFNVDVKKIVQSALNQKAGALSSAF
jgi:DNA polymerase-3 subunit epsilon